MSRLHLGLAVALAALLAAIGAHEATILDDGGTQLLATDGGHCVSYASHIRVPWPDGGVPDGGFCVDFDGLSDAEARAFFCLTPDGGQEYARGRGWAPDVDGDAGMPVIPDGMQAVQDSEVIRYSGACPYRFEAWLPSTEAPFPCACSTGADCEALAIDGGWVTAPAGVTLPEGAWRGAGCWKKVCVEIAGYSSWPLEHCPQ